MPKGYIVSETSVHFMNYHFVWCPKYRRKVLVGKIRKRLEELIGQKCQELNCEVITLAISEDHTHLFVRANPKQAPNSIIGQVKGFTSRILRKEFKELRSRLPTLCHELGHALAYRKYGNIHHSRKMYAQMERIIKYCKKKSFWEEEITKRLAPKTEKPEPTKEELKQQKIQKAEEKLQRYEKKLRFYQKKLSKAKRSLAMLRKVKL